MAAQKKRVWSRPGQYNTVNTKGKCQSSNNGRTKETKRASVVGCNHTGGGEIYNESRYGKVGRERD